MTLSQLIIQRIETTGPLRFQAFMEMCLYHPHLGYYTSANPKIGPTGDFLTSPSLSPLFGSLIGKQLEQMWHLLGQEPFTIVEYGAGTGRLCRDILAYLKNNAPLYESLRYCIIEKSPVMRAIERSHLPDTVSWYESIGNIPALTGCVLSNEVVDTFAVHAVVMGQQLMEVFVGYDHGFQEVLQPASPELINYLEELGVKLPPGFRTEINLEAIQWLQAIAAHLRRGYVLTIDYGDESAELYRPSRQQGTLRGFRSHRLTPNLYEQIGQQDITASVNFSALSHWGTKLGLTHCGLTHQGQFLLALGFCQALELAFSRETNVWQAARQASRLRQALLVDMGLKFKCLVQSKGVDGQVLSGLSGMSAQKR